MKKLPGDDLLHSLLLRGASGRRLWASLVAMAIGLSLLLIAVLIWWNFDQLLRGRASDDSMGSTFLTVSRRVTNENMGHPELTVFAQKDIDELAKAPQVQDIGILRSLRPRAYMSMDIAPGAGFSTIMVLESVPDRFIDRKPADWSWQPGQNTLPIILSSSFLSLYNYAFAPSQGLPQLSEESIKALPFKMIVGDDAAPTTYVARVAGFSDRITSVLVPESFVLYANGPQGSSVSRLVLKVGDPSSTALTDYLASHGYVTNSELLRWSRFRAVVQMVAIIIGVLALLLLGVSLLVFVLFIELTIARARQSVQLLQEIGYSPYRLRTYLNGRFLPLLSLAIGTALTLGLLAQIVAHISGAEWGLHLPAIPGWPIWATLILVCVLIVLHLRRAINGALSRVN